MTYVAVRLCLVPRARPLRCLSGPAPFRKPRHCVQCLAGTSRLHGKPERCILQSPIPSCSSSPLIVMVEVGELEHSFIEMEAERVYGE